MEREKLYYQRWGTGCFQVTRKHSWQSEIVTHNPCSMEFIEYDGEGRFTILEGFAFDGASVPNQPIPQTPAEIYLAAHHDPIYRLIRAGLIPISWIHIANKEMEADAEWAGMPKLIAEVSYFSVDKFGERYAVGGNPELVAP